MTGFRLGISALMLAASVASAAPSSAHAPRQAYMFLRLYGDSTVMRLELAIPDLESALKLGWDTTSYVTADQVRDKLGVVLGYAESHVGIGGDGGRATPRYRGFDFRRAEGRQYLLLEYLVSMPLPDHLSITLSPFFEFDDMHRNLVVIEHNWRTGTFHNERQVSLVLSPREPTQSIDLSSSTIWRGFLALIRLGIWHIWIGLDHILFLVALILPSVLQRDGRRWQPAARFRTSLIKIVTIVTFFTIAHTITLSLAALGVVHLPSALIETAIAVSIAAAAFHNLWPVARINEAAIAFGFGLFHGFGFATVLGELGLGRDHLVLSLLGFNLGVEIGQLAIISAIFPMLFLVRRVRLYQFAMRACSVGLIAIGLLWAAERSMGINVPLVPIARRMLGIAAEGTPL
jgi:hypothetical protein